MLRHRRQRGEKPKAQVDMTSLIDLTFLLLVTFIVTLPALEQGVTIKLPEGKADELPTKDRKANIVTIDQKGNIFFKDNPMTLEDLETTLRSLASADPDVPVLVRGDVRIDYGRVMDAVKIIHKCGLRKMALVTKE